MSHRQEEEDDAGSCCSDFGDINISDSQIMIQLKESEQEAELIREVIAQLKKDLELFDKKEELTEEDAECLHEKQTLLMQKIQELDKLTCLIAKLMELAAGMDNDDEPKFDDDLLPKVVVCSSWDDMMPKIVVCMDQKKKSLKKKTKAEEEFDMTGLSPEQRKLLDEERLKNEQNMDALQKRVAEVECELRFMLKENDMLCQKVADLKKNQPQPFEFEMTVSGTQQPGNRAGPNDLQVQMQPTNQRGENNFGLGASVRQGDCVLGNMAITQPGAAGGGGSMQAGDPCDGAGARQAMMDEECGGGGGGGAGGGQCGGGGQYGGTSPLSSPLSQPPTGLAPGGKKCRKQFMNQWAGAGGGGCQCCPAGKPGADVPCAQEQAERAQMRAQIEANKPKPIDVNFALNVSPVGGAMPTDQSRAAATDHIEQQLREMEEKLKRLQYEVQQSKQ